MQNPQVLQLNGNGEPLALVPWARAVRKLKDGRAFLVAYDPDRKSCSEKWETQVPLIIQLPQFVKLNRTYTGKTVIRAVLYARDNWQCQYCRCDVDDDTASIDHVKPVDLYRREGKTRMEAHVWENVVTACKPCNSKKGNKLPVECGMYPIKTPVRPDWVKLWAKKRYHPIQAKYVAEQYKFDEKRLKVTKIERDFDWDNAWAWK